MEREYGITNAAGEVVVMAKGTGFNEWFVWPLSNPDDIAKFVSKKQALRFAAALLDDPCDEMIPTEDTSLWPRYDPRVSDKPYPVYGARAA